jgi:general secretion pathway protein F
VPVYAYKGVTAAGRSTRGHVDAESLRGARTRLRRDGVFITELAEGSRGRGTRAAASPRFAVRLPSLQRISALDLALATRQMSTLLGAGIPLVDALRALTEQVENPRLKSVFGRVRDRVNEGASLADALAASGAFSDLYVSMVRAGEAGGALEQVLCGTRSARS